MTLRLPEAQVKRDVLLALSRDPGVLLLDNAVGHGYRHTAGPALAQALAPFGALAVAAASGVLLRHRLVYGLGKGSPDLVGAVDGQALGVELKAPRGRVEPHQARWHEAARRRGAAVVVVRSAEEALIAIADLRATRRRRTP